MTPTANRHDKSQRNRIVEFILVVGVAFSTPFFNSLHVFIDGYTGATLSRIAVAGGIIHVLVGLGVLGYVLSRRRLGLQSLGFEFAPSDIVASLLLLPLAIATSWAVYSGEWFGYLYVFGKPPALPTFPIPFALGFSPVVLMFAVADPFLEELVGRAFIITEMEWLTNRTWLAVLVSVTLTTSYHLYEGWLRAGAVAGVFVVFALYYARRRRVWPLILAHINYDLFVWTLYARHR